MLATDLCSFIMRERARLQGIVADQAATFMTIYEVADQYGISLRTIRRKQAAGQMPYRIKVGHKLLYPRAAIQQLFKKSLV